MKWCVYNLLFAVAYAVMMPSFLIRMARRGGYKARMGDRFGRYPRGIFKSGEAPIWIHAVSVGEVSVAGQLMRALRSQDPSIRFVFSTTSSTGWKQAEKELGPHDTLIYNPLDFRRCVRRALDQVRPRAMILTESEIWPNFILELRRREVPLYLINARVSDRSAPRYRALKWWFGEVLRAFTLIFAQSEVDARRLVAAGADASRVKVTGSFKFDVAHRNEPKERELADWIRSGINAGEGELLPGFEMPKADAPIDLPPILLGGSTWPGEDEALIRIYREVLRRNPEVRLVIVPRHFEKADAVEANIRRSGFPCLRRSRAGAVLPGMGATTAPVVYLGDTTGEMMGFFGLATVAFVGKSLCAHGSQNMIEPCLCGVPTLVGPYTENFRPVMSDLLESEAIVQVRDEAALTEEILRLFADPEARAALGERARAAVERRRGVVDRCAAELAARFAAFTPPVPKPPRKLSLLAKCAICAGIALVYALAGWFATPKLRHAWIYLQENATRRYSTFLGLSAASIAMPWCLGDMRSAYINLASRDYGFAKGGQPYKVERQNGLEVAYFANEDYGGDVVTLNGWPWITGEKFKSTRLLKDLLPYALGISRTGAVTNSPLPARKIDARLLSMARMKGILEECRGNFGDFDLWCIGRYDYLATPACEVAADRLMSIFDEPKTFELFAEAGVYSAADLYACYVGSAREVMGAFAKVAAYGPLRGALTASRLAFSPPPTGDLQPVTASRIMPYYLRPVRGLVQGGADELVYASLTGRVNVVQAARREIIRGFDAADGGVSTNAHACWQQAAEINGRDPLLRGLADSLDLEGRRRLRMGDAKGALQCFENRILIAPRDAAAVHNFGVCLKKAGQMDMASRVFLKAVTMDPRNDEHRLEFVECAAASGHEDAASRQMEVLMAHNPGDHRLKIRAAKLLAMEKNAIRNETRAIKLAEEAAAAVNWRSREIVQGLADVYIEAGRVMMGMGLKKRMKEMKFDE